jgi:hypothetical protein
MEEFMIVRSILGITALTPLIFAMSLTACAPKSRYRSKINLGNATAPQSKDVRRDETDDVASPFNDGNLKTRADLSGQLERLIGQMRAKNLRTEELAREANEVSATLDSDEKVQKAQALAETVTAVDVTAIEGTGGTFLSLSINFADGQQVMLSGAVDDNSSAKLTNEVNDEAGMKISADAIILSGNHTVISIDVDGIPLVIQSTQTLLDGSIPAGIQDSEGIHLKNFKNVFGDGIEMATVRESRIIGADGALLTIHILNLKDVNRRGQLTLAGLTLAGKTKAKSDGPIPLEIDGPIPLEIVSVNLGGVQTEEAANMEAWLISREPQKSYTIQVNITGEQPISLELQEQVVVASTQEQVLEIERETDVVDLEPLEVQEETLPPVESE